MASTLKEVHVGSPGRKITSRSGTPKMLRNTVLVDSKYFTDYILNGVGYILVDERLVD